MVKISNDQKPTSVGSNQNLKANVTKQNQIDSKKGKDKIDSKSMNDLKKIILATPDTNSKLVAKIKNQIKLNQYKIDHNELANIIMKKSIEEDIT